MFVMGEGGFREVEYDRIWGHDALGRLTGDRTRDGAAAGLRFVPNKE